MQVHRLVGVPIEGSELLLDEADLLLVAVVPLVVLEHVGDGFALFDLLQEQILFVQKHDHRLQSMNGIDL